MDWTPKPPTRWLPHDPVDNVTAFSNAETAAMQAALDAALKGPAGRIHSWAPSLLMLTATSW